MKDGITSNDDTRTQDEIKLYKTQFKQRFIIATHYSNAASTSDCKSQRPVINQHIHHRQSPTNANNCCQRL